MKFLFLFVVLSTCSVSYGAVSELKILKKCIKVLFQKSPILSNELHVYGKRIESGKIDGGDACLKLIDDSFLILRPANGKVHIMIKNYEVYESLKRVLGHRFRFHGLYGTGVLEPDPDFVSLNEPIELMVFYFLVDSNSHNKIFTSKYRFKRFVKQKNTLVYEIDNSVEGGIMQNPSYLFLNYYLKPDKLQTGEVIARNYAESILSDFLCIELPNLLTSDVEKYVDTKSELAFARNSRCINCHVTMDPLVGFSRSYIKRKFTTKNGMLQTKIVDLAQGHKKAPAVFLKYDSSYSQQEKSSRLEFRDDYGKYYRKTFKTYEEMARTLAGMTQTKYCSIKHLFKSLDHRAELLEVEKVYQVLRSQGKEQSLRHMLVEVIKKVAIDG